MLRFERLLLDSLPFKKGDQFAAPDCDNPPARAKRAIEMFIARGVRGTSGLLEIAKNRGEDEFLRLQAISFLRYLGVKKSLAHLETIANSQSESIPLRRSAIVSICSFRPKNTFAMMRPLLLNDPSEEIRLSVVAGFAVYPDRRMFDLLTEVAFSDQGSRVRGEAIRQIAAYCNDESKNKVFGILVKKLQEPEEGVIVRAHAVEGFGNLLEPRGLDIVVSYLSNPAPEIRLMAAYSLGQLGDARHLHLLREMADDSGVLEGWGTVAEAVEQAINNILENDDG